MTRVKVLLFAALVEQLGVREVELDLPAQVPISEALDELVGRYPELGAALEKTAVAVNLEYVGRGHLLADGDEMALIPPVSGG